MTDTIAAIATPPGVGGIAVVRLSGPEAFEIADRVFLSKLRPSQALSHTVHYGRIKDPKTEEVIDEVLITVFRAPKSYTTEDLIEISCHGGPGVARAVLSALLAAGARPAKPGEFTQRAVLLGRIDLAQAEAVLELCQARSDQARRIALEALNGAFSRTVRALQAQIGDVLSHIEAAIQFPDEGGELDESWVKCKLDSITSDLFKLESRVLAGRPFIEGVKVTICGAVNVGKSSLFNALLGEPRAIVDEAPGTTRDWIETELRLDGINFRLQDTAGFSDTDGIGVVQARQVLKEADLLIGVFDGSRELQAPDLKLLSLLRDRPHILVINKSDLSARLDTNSLAGPALRVSALLGLGLDDLKLRLKALSSDKDAGMLYNERWVSGLRSARGCLDRARTIPLMEARVEELISAQRQLAELIGEAVAPEILDQVFERFCIGK